jgi:hypothetical protein
MQIAVAVRIALRVVLGHLLIVSLACLSGCAGLSPATRNSIAGVALLGVTPSTDLEQVYYLGMFDPQEQIPPTLYRVRVRGQASALNFNRYASGWVHADLIDSLSTAVKFASKDADANVSVTPAAGEDFKSFTPGRRLVMFGPEGFREAPANHRLVIAMGSSPEKFFSAVDQALGNVAAATQGNSGPGLERSLFREMLRLKSERERLEDLRTEAAATGVTP